MRRKKKVVEPVVEENVEEIIVPEVTIEMVDVIPEDAEVVDEVVIEPVEEIIEEPIVEEVKDDTIRVGDSVVLIEPIDYFGRPIPQAINRTFRVYGIHADKALLKDRGLIGPSTKVSNLKKI